MYEPPLAQTEEPAGDVTMTNQPGRWRSTKQQRENEALPADTPTDLPTDAPKGDDLGLHANGLAVPAV